MREDHLRTILTVRTSNPGAIATAAATRQRPTSLLGDHGRLMMIAADHSARGMLSAGDRPMAMADRADLLDRLCLALSRPGVNGVLGTPDVIEDLLLLGALEDKVVVGSMNRGGLAGSVFELDDRFTAYDADTVVNMGYQGGKMLLRIDLSDRASVRTIESCGQAVSELAAHHKIAMIEPFLSRRVVGKVHNELTADAMIKAMTVAAGIGNTSAYSWLKVPIVPDMARVMAATTLPAVILGGEVSSDPEATFEQWRAALTLPTVRGLVVGRSLLYPPDDDVGGAVDTAVSLF
jgi:DhnA family fructose-bisphosphate aldolase class Ia